MSYSDGQLQENRSPKTYQEEQKQQQKQRLCDFCGESIALLYCRADSAKLCFNCDRQVHSTNQLFTKHTRSLLCDSCDSSPSSIFCSTHSSVLCQNCDWESHSLSLSPVHDRRPIEGFNGCPSVTELLANFGFDELGKKNKKGLFGCGEDDAGFVGSENYRFSDYLIWDTPSVVSLDDLISSNGSDHNFQAMGVPPLPKNRNTVCGQHKEEILCQLREMAILEPNFDDDKQDLESSSGFRSHLPEQNCQQLDTYISFEHKAEPTFFPSLEARPLMWCSYTGEDADQGLPSTSLQNYFNTNCMVPDKDSEIGHCFCHENNGHEAQSESPVITEAAQILPKVAPREFSIQDRNSAITRYKEKRKSRRYDKRIRYESRKVRAESRIRIKGRFAKMDH